jgi:hypothetical protein
LHYNTENRSEKKHHFLFEEIKAKNKVISEKKTTKEDEEIENEVLFAGSLKFFV